MQCNTSSGMDGHRKKFMPNLSQSALTIDGARESLHTVGRMANHAGRATEMSIQQQPNYVAGRGGREVALKTNPSRVE